MIDLLLLVAVVIGSGLWYVLGYGQARIDELRRHVAYLRRLRAYEIEGVDISGQLDAMEALTYMEKDHENFPPPWIVRFVHEVTSSIHDKFSRSPDPQ